MLRKKLAATLPPRPCRSPRLPPKLHIRASITRNPAVKFNKKKITERVITIRVVGTGEG